MLKRFLNAYRLVAADARDAVADTYHRIVDTDADKDAAFFAVATKTLCAGAIFCEVAMADGKISAREQERIRELLLIRFGLDDAEADALFKIGQQTAADNSRLPRMTASVRDHFSHEERIELIEMLFDTARDRDRGKGRRRHRPRRQGNSARPRQDRRAPQVAAAWHDVGRPRRLQTTPIACMSRVRPIPFRGGRSSGEP
jgi:uncharacterized tellurite resistance protein B-like protein